MPIKHTARRRSRDAAACATDQQILNCIPTVGKALFLASSRSVRAAIRPALKKTILSYLECVKNNDKDGSKEFKEIIALRFLLLKILDKLILEVSAELPASIVTAFSGVTAIRNDWQIFATFASWLMNECNTTRVSAGGVRPPAKRRINTSLHPTRNPISRSKIKGHVDSFRLQRQANKGQTSPEHRKNDPIEQILSALSGTLPVGTPSGSKINIINNIITKLETEFVSKLTSFNIINIPLEPKLSIVLSLLLRLNQDHHVWKHVFTFGIDPLIQEIINETVRREVLSKLKSNAGHEQDIVKRIRKSMVIHIAGLLSTEFVMGREFKFDNITAIMNAELELVRNVAEQAIKEEDIALADIASILEKSPTSEFEVKCKHFKNKLIQCVLDQALTHHNASNWNFEFVKEGMAMPAGRHDGQDFLELITAAITESKEIDVLSALGSDPFKLKETVQGAIVRHLGIPSDWSVAIPIIGWHARKGNNVPFGPFTSLDALAKEWGHDMESALVEYKDIYKRNMLCLVVKVQAPSVFLAYRKAQLEAESLLGIVWMRHSFHFSAKLAPMGFLRSHSDNTIHGQTIMPNDSIPPLDMTSADLTTIQEAAHEFYLRRNTRTQRVIWEQLSYGLGYLRSALLSEQIHDRYLYLWMALEAILGNFDSDSRQYEGEITIGQLITYRAGLLRVPSDWMVGLTYGQARSIYAFELKALYKFRNQAVHQGQRHPIINESMIDRFRDAVVAVYHTVLVNTFRYGMRSVEEILAWCQSKKAAGNVIPADLRKR